jgi:predicted RND superfamily exporter protein
LAGFLIINKFIITKKKTMNLILSYLLAEGFASDEKSAINIYEAMSDEWLEQIIEMYKQGEPLPPEDQEALDKIRKRLAAMGSVKKTSSTPVYTPEKKRKPKKLEFEVK